MIEQQRAMALLEQRVRVISKAVKFYGVTMDFNGIEFMLDLESRTGDTIDFGTVRKAVVDHLDSLDKTTTPTFEELVDGIYNAVGQVHSERDVIISAYNRDTGISFTKNYFLFEPSLKIAI
jgi:hypothetical protein